MKKQVWCVSSCNIIEFRSIDTAIEYALSFPDSPKGPLNLAIVGDSVWACREENLIRFNYLESAVEWADEFSTDSRKYEVGVATLIECFVQ